MRHQPGDRTVLRRMPTSVLHGFDGVQANHVGLGGAEARVPEPVGDVVQQHEPDRDADKPEVEHRKEAGPSRLRPSCRSVNRRPLSCV